MNDDLKNSINYIKDKTEGYTGFSIPENYLDGIEDDFSIKLSEDKLPQYSSFTTPNAYFDTLEDTILNKVNAPKKGKVISLKSRFKKLAPIAVAASFLLFFTFQFLNNDTSPTFENISYVDVENWLDENTLYTDTELAFAFEDNLDETELSLSEVSFNNDALEDYFDSIDHSDLLNEIQ